MNASKLFVVFASIFALVLASGFASATVDFVNVTGATQTLAQGSQAIVSFNVQATTFLGQINSAQLVLPLIFSSSNNAWTGDTEHLPFCLTQIVLLRLFALTCLQHKQRAFTLDKSVLLEIII